MSIQTEVRRESYEKAKPNFNEQERLVLECLVTGPQTAWEIRKMLMWVKQKEMLITSIRRTLTDLSKPDKKRGRGVIIEAIGKREGLPNGPKVTTYQIIPTLFDEIRDNSRIESWFRRK